MRGNELECVRLSMCTPHLGHVSNILCVQYTNQAELEHELEIELDSAETLKQARRAGEGQENRYAELVRTLVERVRKLNAITA